DVNLEWIHYSISNTYNYISLTNTWNDTQSADGSWTINDATQNCAVYLNTAVFYKFAQIDVIGKFKNDDTIYEGKVNVIISLGDNTDLHNLVFNHVASQLDATDILHNILETRREDGMLNEKGDFCLDSEYMMYDISYSVPTSSSAIIESTPAKIVDTGSADYGRYLVTINPEGFYTTKASVGINVTIEIKEGYGISDTSLTQETRTLYFTTPPALTPDNYGFSNDSVFNSVKYQVFQQLPADERIASTGFAEASGKVTNSTGRYILLRDLIYCDSLHFSLDETVTDTSNAAVYDLMRLIEWASGTDKVAASAIGLNGSYTGNTTITDYDLTYKNGGTYTSLPSGTVLTTTAPASQTTSGTY
ncbi:MAG TPA: hypothetical protein PLT66_09420, partial [Bacillota bacterium]|nr:hypothetical protein [Bacillota bacterium]